MFPIKQYRNGKLIISSPDLSLILPIARVFHVSTDVLFSFEEENDNHKVFDNAYDNYWQKDVKEMYNTAKLAVKEFPSDYKYLQWLAYTEYYIALDEINNDSFISMLNKAKKHFDIVINNCTDNEIRQEALYGIILVLKELNNIDEAKKYANLFPKREEYDKDMLLEFCSEKEELLKIRQKLFIINLLNY